MSLGSDFATGYGLGLKTTDMDTGSAVNPVVLLNTLNQSHRPMQGHNVLKGGKTAKEILDESRKTALELKEKDLTNKEKELTLKETALNNAATRGLQIAQADELRATGEAERSRQGVLDAEARAEKARGVETTEKTERRNQLLQEAMRGFYTGDAQAVKNYFDIFGQPGVSIENIITSSKGQIIVDFGNGKQARFDSPREAIEQLLVPAQLIEQGIEDRMTEKEKATLGINKQRADIYQKSVEGLGVKRSGELTETDKAKERAKFITEYKKLNGKFPTDKEVAEFERLTFGEKSGQGLNTEPDPYRLQADEAIAAGADPDKVSERYKEITGKDY